MERSRYFLTFGTLMTLFAIVVFVAGCQRTSTTSNDSDHSSHQDHDSDHAHAEGAESDHAHEPGSHGGTIVPVGQDNYHVEAVFDADGKLHLYTLGRDESRVQEVDVQELTAHVTPEGGKAVQFTMTADRQKDDAEGKTSAFVGEVPGEVRDKAFEVAITSIRIDGERFRIRFSSEDSHLDSHDEDAPAAAPKNEQQSLYLTPGGAYTADDIAANGNTTAAEKFAGLISNHNLEPSPGDRICPVTLTKSNSQFSWVVGGKKYEFCCPPCIDEFVAKAKKTNPEELKAPETFVKE
jgi:YHS domain-containing protein